MSITITFESLSDDDLVRDILSSRFKDKVNFTLEFWSDASDILKPYLSKSLIAWITSQSYLITVIYKYEKNNRLKNLMTFTHMKKVKSRQL